MTNAQEDSEKQQLPPDLLKYTGIWIYLYLIIWLLNG